MSEGKRKEYARRTPEQNKATSEKLSKARKVMWTTRSEEKRKKISKKISEGQLGKIVSEETRKKISEAGTGRIASDYTKQRMTDSQKTRWENVDRKEISEKFSNAQKNHVPEHTKQKIQKILDLLAKGMSVKDVAKEMLCSDTYAYKIRNGKVGFSVQEKNEVYRKPTGLKRNSPESKKRMEKIKELTRQGVPGTEIARRVKCSRSYISKVQSTFI